MKSADSSTSVAQESQHLPAFESTTRIRPGGHDVAAYSRNARNYKALSHASLKLRMTHVMLPIEFVGGTLFHSNRDRRPEALASCWCRTDRCHVRCRECTTVSVSGYGMEAALPDIFCTPLPAHTV
jgi:hypothetical protein